MPSITVAFVYSARPRQVIEKIMQLAQGSTVAQALQAFGLSENLPEIASTPADGVGVWGKKMALGHVLRDLDRVEVYRPLTVDPKVARRERFVGQGAKKAAGLFANRRLGAKAGY